MPLEIVSQPFHHGLIDAPRIESQTSSSTDSPKFTSADADQEKKPVTWHCHEASTSQPQAAIRSPASPMVTYEETNGAELDFLVRGRVTKDSIAHTATTSPELVN